MSNGLSARSGVRPFPPAPQPTLTILQLIGNIFRKSLRLSGRARTEHSVGKITTMISADTARLDRFFMFGHNLWVAPIQLIIGIGLLIGNVSVYVETAMLIDHVF